MTPLQVFRETDCNPDHIRGRQITVVGFGSQGKAFALNLRDSGCNVQVALRDDSLSRQQVMAERLPLRAMTAVGKSDMVVLAIPDHEQPRFYQQYFSEKDRGNRMLVFLHGLNIHFSNIIPNSAYDVVLLAPHGPGRDLREKYVAGTGLSCFLAIAQDTSGRAREVALALASAIGASKAGVYETTFAHETMGDLFGEQTLLVGGLAGLTMSVFRTMIGRGIPPENAYLETVKQLHLLATMIEEHGPAGMIERVSKTAASGSLETMHKLFGKQFDHKLQEVYDDIASGEFNRRLMADADAGFPVLRKSLTAALQDECQRVTSEFSRRKENQ
jgi:ketol-acid reductoisomerase